MLALFRAFLNTWAARAFFVVLVAAFALWGVADMLRNVGHDNALAVVGDRRIEPAEFQDAFRRELNQVARMLGPRTEPTPQIRKAVAAQTLERLIVQAALSEEVQRLGIVVPDPALREAVFQIPAFRGPTGSFDRAQFDAVLRNNNLSEARFVELMRTDLAQQQVLGSVQAGVAAPEQLLKEMFAFQKQTRVADYVELPFSAAAEPAEPTREDLQRQYENNPAAYSAPAYRRIKLVVLSPDTIARQIEVSPEDVEAYYEQHKSDFVTPEKRSAEVIVAQDEDAAKKLAAAWAAGADWASMQKAAADAGASAVKLEESTEEQFPSPDLADATFHAAPGVVTGPIKSAFGWQVLRVTNVVPGASRSLEQARDEVRAKVAHDRAVDLVYERANKLDDALSAGTSLSDLPGDLGLAAATGTLDAEGNTAEGEPAPIPGPPALRQAIITAAFSTPKGEPPRLVEGPDQSYYALEVEEVIEPKLKPFAEVEAQVREDWEEAQRRHEQEQQAAKLMAAAQAGGSLDDAATVAGVRVEKTPPVGRSTPTEGVPSEVQGAIFKLKQGETTMVETPEGFWVVRLAEINDPDPANDPASAAQIREALNRSLDQDVQIVFTTALRDRLHPRVNRTLLDKILE